MLSTFIIVLGAILATLILFYFYWIYVPKPILPDLSNRIQSFKIDAGGIERSFIGYIPKSLKNDQKPALVIVLHGAGIDGKTIRDWTGFEFDKAADKKGFIVLYPDGYKKNWNESRKVSSYPAKKENIDDVGFIKSLIDRYVDSHGVDPSKIFIFGYSNGGEMAYKIAIDHPNLINAISTISSSLPTSDNTNSHITEIFTRVMMVHGTKDFIVPFAGGKIFLFGQDLGSVISSNNTAQIFADTFGATKDNQTIRLPHHDISDTTSVDLQKWRLNGEVVVQHYTVYNGGHVVPQQINKMPRLMGRVTKDLNAPKEAISFFKLD